MGYIACFCIAACLLVPLVAAQTSATFEAILLEEVTEAAKFFFSKNRRLDNTGFNTIAEDEFWEVTDLFQRYYGDDVSTARFTAAILDFEYYVSRNFTFSNVVQLILVGEHQDARKAFSAHAEITLSAFMDTAGRIKNVKNAKEILRSRFRSIYDLVGNDNFASFLNLKVGSSLSFVIDTTGSMSDEIEAVKSRVVEIIERTKGTNSAPLNYVLMPYNDPGYGPVAKTTDADKFIESVNVLFANGGGDEPELAMIGILEATHASGFRSIMYVFTDASAKDHWLQSHVIALCLTKKISVFFFITRFGSADFLLSETAAWTELYEEIAAKTGGQILSIPKEDVSSATAIMEATTVQGLVTLVSISNTSSSVIEVDVDSSVSSLLVQVLGVFIYTGYDGPDVTSFVNLTEITEATLFRLEGTKPGRYRFNFEDDGFSNFGIIIRGKSSLGFHAHLSQKSSGSEEFVASRQLLAGESTKAEMTVYGDSAQTTFTQFQLISRNSEVLYEASLTKLTETQYAVPDIFSLPEYPMFVRLIGTYQGMTLVRIDPCAITPTVTKSSLEKIGDATVRSGDSTKVTAVLHNRGVSDTFTVLVSDNRDFISLDGSTDEGLEVDLESGKSRIIVMTIKVPSGTATGLLSKVLLSATAKTGEYFVFSTFVISVVDDVIRCESPTSPIGGRLECSPDAQSVGSVCFLRCDDEYVLEGDDKIECQSDGTWNPQALGNCKYRESQTCSLYGDPHYMTFDGLAYDFQGTCLYTLLETREDSGLQPVSIQVKNDHYYGLTHVSWFHQAMVKVYNTTITLKQGQIVLIDGILATLPRTMHGVNLQVLFDGPDVLIRTDFKLEIRLNGAHTFRVSLPASYREQVWGLCGNYDGVSSNDLMIGNQSFSDPTDFGNALAVLNGSQPWCREGAASDNALNIEDDEQREAIVEKCSLLKSSCFEGCTDNSTVEQLFDDCVFDLAALDGADKIVEEYISDFAASCVDRGIEVCNWREDFEFPTPNCGLHKHYEFRGNRCPNTCADPKAAERCVAKIEVEGCFCDDGFVLDGTDCVPISECGCAVEGKYYKSGYTFVEKDCSRECTCEGGVLSCSAMTCRDGTHCAILASGKYGCQENALARCQATGDPRYMTLDGARFDYQGTCRYIMLKMIGERLENADENITVSTQNEHRNGQTVISFVQSVNISFESGLEIQIGPRTEVYTSGATPEDVQRLVTIEKNNRVTVRTKVGIVVIFDGTNLYIDVPDTYKNNVAGLCGDYNGIPGDDFDAEDIQSFADTYRYQDSCIADDSLPEPFVCSPEMRAEMEGNEACGKLTDPDGPFQYCVDDMDITGAFENCVLDFCSTGNSVVFLEAMRAAADECINAGAPLPCDWEVQLGIAPDCPANSKYACDSVCQDTCQDPTASKRCSSLEETAQCVCLPGYVLDGGQCVRETTCGCALDDGTYVETGYSKMAPDCDHLIECSGPGVVSRTENPCGNNSRCLEGRKGDFQCVPKELPHALVFGSGHCKSIDGHFFDFRGNCAYLLAGYASESTEAWSFRVYIVNGGKSGIKVEINEIIIKYWMESTTHVVRVNREKAVTVDGVKVAIGSKIGPMTVSVKRGKLAFDFEFGLHVRYDGKDWVKVEVAAKYEEALTGIGSKYGVLGKDVSVDSPEKWGDLWIQEEFSTAECSRTTPIIEKPCPLRKRYERRSDCGILTETESPFVACHERVDPAPFKRACVSDACNQDGSASAMTGTMEAYRVACLGRGINISMSSVDTGIVVACSVNSHYSSCANECQPSCTDLTPECKTESCEEGCVCDDGFVLSNGNCIPESECGCTTEEGVYFEHGGSHVNNDCSTTCTCVHGKWNCETLSCNKKQSCRVMNGLRDCYWKDLCKYDNGGCSDICTYIEGNEIECSCRPERILTKDNSTCVDISPIFLDYGSMTGTCGVVVNIWASLFNAWRTAHKIELKERNADACKVSWTDWYDRDDPTGSGDEETLETLRVEYPEICEDPITSQARLADGRDVRGTSASFEVNPKGVFCRNADQVEGVDCPDLAIRFLCHLLP